jgi:hypothetical protein
LCSESAAETPLAGSAKSGRNLDARYPVWSENWIWLNFKMFQPEFVATDSVVPADGGSKMLVR